MKIVIVGAGEVGYHIAKALYLDNDVIVIDNDEDACERANGLDIQVIQNNGANASILTDILKNADLLVAVTGIDEVNIVACMASKIISREYKDNKLITIARVSNPDYIDQPVAKRESIGIDVMICPELTLASEVADVLSVPSAIDLQFFAEGKVEMLEFVVHKDNAMVNSKIKDIDFGDDCIVSAIFRDEDVLIPHGEDLVMENDRIVVIGKASSMDHIRSLFGETIHKRNKIMIIGGGSVGFYLANMIYESNFDIKIVEMDRERCDFVSDRLPDVLVLNSDGTDVELLEEENIADMDVVISVTDSDEKNLLCSLIAKQFGVKKVIARVDRPEYVSLFEMVGVDSAVSPRGSTIKEVFKFTMGTSMQAIATLEGEKAEVVEYTVTKRSRIEGKTLEKIPFPRGVIVSMVVRGELTIVPSGDFRVLDGDRLVMFSLQSDLDVLKHLFK
ncbi:Trk system potassium transporter TrkA [Methanosalsum natronophilum]|uniref:Trk system potassium transporter TrkA n=1 Tax=Methanosalsum natronophilum TaxID=768733 RepID=A0A3R7VS09_9EURY|nr:Trk system potassium transporter TrkA [Methanosalsum natronophilum]MCS3923212.1 trk system potassium uptake protein TrkA [Methanosalsum natronophilum]RQD82401.1 MAG: Trk system potassium transporter TrkA [Methanosalsum natronophilum]